MRVIAGTAKGRKLVAPPGDHVRPTADRTKEALFSILHTQVIGASVLDLFAGAGSLGIEALSRGADHVTFVERDRRALQALERNLGETDLTDRADVVRTDVLAALGQEHLPGAPFDLVLLDPPYGIDRAVLHDVLAALTAHAAAGATVTLELGHHGEPLIAPAAVRFDEPRRYGDTHLHVGTTADTSPSHGRGTSGREGSPR